MGHYRRKGGNAHPPASFFDPNNQEGARQRELAAQEAFNDLLKWYAEGGVVAVLDATNSTRKRREWIQMKCDDAGIRLMFVESVCDSEELVLSNILDVKVSSPDYIGQDPEQVKLTLRFERVLTDRRHLIFEIVFDCTRNITRQSLRMS